MIKEANFYVTKKKYINVFITLSLSLYLALYLIMY